MAAATWLAVALKGMALLATPLMFRSKGAAGGRTVYGNLLDVALRGGCFGGAFIHRSLGSHVIDYALTKPIRHAGENGKAAVLGIEVGGVIDLD